MKLPVNININYFRKIIIILIINNLIIISINGCTSTKIKTIKTNKNNEDSNNRYFFKNDHAPDIANIPDIKSIPNATPKFEPKSRYGNPKSYSVFNKKYKVLSSSNGYSERGLASWYGNKFHGHRTSSSEKYDMFLMTAAHKTLPLPTYAEVTNLDNGKKVIVKINDRGPFHNNRILDLSYAAAYKLDIIGKGTGKVQVKAINPINYKSDPDFSPDLPDLIEFNKEPNCQANAQANTTEQYLQFGVFSSNGNAEKLKTKLQDFSNFPVQIQKIQDATNKQNILFKVLLGPIKEKQSIENLNNLVASANLPEPVLVH